MWPSSRRGITDDAVLELASTDGRVLLTADKDFGELVFRLHRVVHGVVLARLVGIASSSRADAVSQALADHGREMTGAFTVVSPGLVRIRLPL